MALKKQASTPKKYVVLNLSTSAIDAHINCRGTYSDRKIEHDTYEEAVALAQKNAKDGHTREVCLCISKHSRSTEIVDEVL